MQHFSNHGLQLDFIYTCFYIYIRDFMKWSWGTAEAYPELCQTSKTELAAKIVNGESWHVTRKTVIQLITSFISKVNLWLVGTYFFINLKYRLSSTLQGDQIIDSIIIETFMKMICSKNTDESLDECQRV